MGHPVVVLCPGGVIGATFASLVNHDVRSLLTIRILLRSSCWLFSGTSGRSFSYPIVSFQKIRSAVL